MGLKKKVEFYCNPNFKFKIITIMDCFFNQIPKYIKIIQNFFIVLLINLKNFNLQNQIYFYILINILTLGNLIDILQIKIEFQKNLIFSLKKQGMIRILVN